MDPDFQEFLDMFQRISGTMRFLVVCNRSCSRRNNTIHPVTALTYGLLRHRYRGIPYSNLLLELQTPFDAKKGARK